MCFSQGVGTYLINSPAMEAGDGGAAVERGGSAKERKTDGVREENLIQPNARARGRLGSGSAHSIRRALEALGVQSLTSHPGPGS